MQLDQDTKNIVLSYLSLQEILVLCKNDPKKFRVLLVNHKYLPNIDWSAEQGYLESVAYLHSREFVPTSRALNYACLNGHIDVVKYLILLNIRPDKKTLNFAFQSRNLDLVKYLVYLGVKPNHISLYFVAKRGYTEMVKYLVDTFDKTLDAPQESKANRATDIVAIKGHYEILKILCGADYIRSPNILSNVLQSHDMNLDVVKLLYALGYQITRKDVNEVAIVGNLEVLKYLYSLGSKVEEDLEYIIDEKPPLDIVIYILENGYMGNFDTEIEMLDSLMESAIGNGLLEIVKYLVSKGATIHQSLIDHHTEDLDMLKYLISLGLIPTQSNFNQALELGNLETVEYLSTLGYQINLYDMNNFATRGYLSLIKYGVEQKVIPTQQTIETAIEYGRMDIVKFLVELGIMPTRNAMYVAITKDQFEIVKYLVEIGIKFDQTEIDLAKDKTFGKIWKYLESCYKKK